MQFSDITFRKPKDTDGFAVNRMIRDIPELDRNSVYCNLLQCSHFAETSIVVEKNDEILGFISAYLKPNEPSTLFVWQVAVSAQARGLGIASRMLQMLLERDEMRTVTHIETTITERNEASWALFSKFSDRHKVSIERSVMFDHFLHFSDEHDTELLARIGPILR